MVTLKEAQARWNNHTRYVLTDSARESFKAGRNWGNSGFTPVIRSKDGLYSIYFMRDRNGRVFATEYELDGSD
jgi:hypothetical protein